MNKSQWRLYPQPSTHLPRLAWVANTPLKGGEIRVTHGSFVETTEEWIVEGCWDAPFADGDFHLRENFFGSGIRITADSVIFCSSLAMVDRLIYAQYKDQVIISNSLVLILAVTGAELDIKHDYHEECYGLLQGILKYPREFRVIHSEIDTFYQVFSANLILDANGLNQEPRSQPQSIGDYAQYLSLLTLSLKALNENANSPFRRHAMKGYSTLSSGYDSTAVTCLVKDLGITTCFTTRPGGSRKSKVLEDGGQIAEVLGLDTVLLDPEEASVSENEVFFLAPTYEGCEVIFDRMAKFIEDRDEPSIVFTGYHGDKIWDRSSKGKYLSDEIIRGDTSGLNLSEIRLKAGFVNIAVPFIFARSARDIVSIANSSSMKAWQTNNDYDRPIPRRISETHGVPGNYFGQKKQAILSYYTKPINKKLRRDFMKYLKETVGIRSLSLFLYDITESFDFTYCKILEKFMPNKTFKEVPWSLRRFIFRKDLNLRVHMFIWACSYLKSRLNHNDMKW